MSTRVKSLNNDVNKYDIIRKLACYLKCRNKKFIKTKNKNKIKFIEIKKYI